MLASATLKAELRNSVQVDHRVSQCLLAADEDGRESESDAHREHGQPAQAVLHDLLQAVDHRQHGGDRQQRAQQVRAAGRRVAEFGQQDRAGDQQQHHDRHADQEHGAPPEVLEQDPADQWPDGGAHGEAGAPDADRFVRSTSSSNIVRSSDSVDGTSAAPARPSSARVAISISALVENAASVEAAPKAARADQQQFAAADSVAETADRDERAGQDEAVDVDDPQQLGSRRFQRRAEVGHGEVEDREVHHRDHARQGEDGEAEPGAARCLMGAHMS